MIFKNFLKINHNKEISLLSMWNARYREDFFVDTWIICVLRNSGYCQTHKEIKRTLIAFYIQLSIPLFSTFPLWQKKPRPHDSSVSAVKEQF